MSEDQIKFFINDKEVSAPNGTMIIEAADQYDIDIPRFCYHKKLSIAANCRMCMVEVEKAPKPLPACATPVAEGMKVYTKSPLALDAQKGTMEFLLINHPLDCPVCDQGGECELQDVAMGYGKDVSRYIEQKRVVPDKELGPLVSTDMTRCIHCTRCVRFGSEVAGLRELGATGRGEFMEIGTYVERALSSELSGNVIDVCPVGALNAKPSRMTARSWEMLQAPTISPHDSVGSNIYVHILRDEAMRVVPRENEELNETWISDRDRFSYEGLNTQERAHFPMLKNENKWSTADWDASLERVTEILEAHQPEDIGVLAAPHSTVEELYLLQKIFRGLNVQNIDHRLQQIDFSDQASMPLFPYLGQTVQELEKNDSILLIGSNIRLEQPILAHRMRKASLRGCKIIALNSQQYDFYFKNQSTWNLAPQFWVNALAEIVRCAGEQSLRNIPSALRECIEQADYSNRAQEIFNQLSRANNSSVILGAIHEGHPHASNLRALGNLIAKFTDSKFGLLASSGNSAGAWLSGMLPHRQVAGREAKIAGMHTIEMLDTKRKVYVLFNVEPEFDCADANLALNAIQGAQDVIVFTPYVTEQIKAYANVILPIATFAETEGTFVNTEGRWQSVNSVVKAPEDARPAWRVLRVLANKLGLAEFQYQSSKEIRDELRKLLMMQSKFNSELKNMDHITSVVSNGSLYRVSSMPVYGIDNVVRRAKSLQETIYEQQPFISMCKEQAQELDILDQDTVRVIQGAQESILPLQIDQTLPMQCVWIQKSAKEIDSLGSSIAPVEVRRNSNA